MNAEFLNSDPKKEEKSMYPRKCEACSKILKTRKTFNQHKGRCGRKKPEYPRTCDICNRLYKSRSSFSNHKKKCSLFSLQFYKMNAEFPNSDPKKEDKSVYPRKCEACSKILKTKQTFLKHKTRCGKKKSKYPRTCEICSKYYTSRYCFSYHKKKCSLFSLQSYKMNTEFLNSDLKKEEKSVYPRKCEACFKILKTKQTFLKHKRRCGKKKSKYPRTCEICNKHYTSRYCFSKHKKKCSMFSLHINKMNAEFLNSDLKKEDKSMYPQKCETCLKIFETRQTFSKHKWYCGKKNSEYPRACDICNKCYASPSSFSNHKKKCKPFDFELGTSSLTSDIVNPEKKKLNLIYL